MQMKLEALKKLIQPIYYFKLQRVVFWVAVLLLFFF